MKIPIRNSPRPHLCTRMLHECYAVKAQMLQPHIYQKSSTTAYTVQQDASLSSTAYCKSISQIFLYGQFSPTYQLSKHLCYLLAPLQGHTKSAIPNSKQFFTFITTQELAPNESFYRQIQGTAMGSLVSVTVAT